MTEELVAVPQITSTLLVVAARPDPRLRGLITVGGSPPADEEPLELR
jgi:hypothetical protein